MNSMKKDSSKNHDLQHLFFLTLDNIHVHVYVQQVLTDCMKTFDVTQSQATCI